MPLWDNKTPRISQTFKRIILNNLQLKQLETELWSSADNLRANSKLTAAEYKDPLLGLILLRYAQNRFEQAKVEIEANIPEKRGTKRAADKDDFKGSNALWLDEESRYDYLVDLPEGSQIGEAVNNAMLIALQFSGHIFNGSKKGVP